MLLSANHGQILKKFEFDFPLTILLYTMIMQILVLKKKI